MEKNEKSSIFILNIDEEGRKIYTSQSDPSKRYMLDDDGNLTECTPDLLMQTIKMESDYELSADSTSNDGILVGDSDCIIAQLQNAGGLDMMSHLEHVSALDDTETLISEIDAANSSRRHMSKINLMDPDDEEEGDDDDSHMMIENVDVTGDSHDMAEDDEDDYSLMQHMDIREPLSTLKKLLEQRLGVELPGYEFWLQNAQMLESHKNLVDQCVQGEGLVQVNVQIQTHLKRINIADVLKPAEDYVDESSITDSLDAETSTSANITLGDDIITAATTTTTTTATFQNQQTSENNNTDSTDKPQNVIKWLVDPQFRRDQERLRIPKDPYAWTPKHVSHWLQWAVRHFKLSQIKLMDWNISGRELCQMTLPEFQARVPKDPGDIFWTHLELLRKCKFVAVVQKEKVTPEQKRQPRLMKPTRPKVMPLDYDKISVMDTSYNGNRSGNNGQIQLWQFLLELLTSKEYRHAIQWLGTEGEFKLISPELVAQLWGDRKNKPTMNYEKLSRALRYYYDGDMISKVHGKRFVYKFVCDLKQLLGYSALELARLVDGPTIDVDLS